MELQNLTPYTWRITAVTGTDSLAGSQVVSPHAAVEMRLPADTYTLEQCLLDPDGQEGAKRRIALTAAAGSRYLWPLATLQAGTDQDLPGRDYGHE